MIVDDNPTNQVLATAIANVLGYDAIIAENGIDGVIACLERTPAAVLMDVNMPLMDGIEATRLIRAAQRRGEVAPLAIIGATANTLPEIVRACGEAGMDVVLHKPFGRARSRRPPAAAVPHPPLDAEGTALAAGLR